MGRRRVLLIAMAALVLAAAAALLLLPWGGGAPPQRVACQDLHQGCAMRLDGRELTVGVSGELRALQAFELWVRAAGARRVEARFDMVEMNMGFNLYTLRPDAEGVFRARVTLPVCVSGRRDWLMTLEVDGRRVEVPFSTEL